MIHNRSPLLVSSFFFLAPYQDFHLILQLSDRGEHRYRYVSILMQRGSISSDENFKCLGRK